MKTCPTPASFKTRLFLFFRVFMVCILIQTLASGAVFWGLQKSLKIKIDGFWLPSVIAPRFWVMRAHFDWKNKVTFFSGNIKVDYNLLPFLIGQGIKITASGGPAEVELQGDWAQMQGVSRAVIRRFTAGFYLDSAGIREVNQLDVISEVFKFQLSER